MNCEKVRELLVTDYIDRELDADTEERVIAHLAQCASCKAFEATVRMSAVEPFKDARPIAPPKHVWERVAGAIETEHDKRSALSWPKSVFVAATVAMLMVAVALFAHNQYTEQRSLNLYIEEEMMSFASIGENSVIGDEDLYGPGNHEKLSALGNSRAGLVV